MSPHHNNPYLSSIKYRENCSWWDTFAKSGKVAYLVFQGPHMLAEVKNEQQARNVVDAVNGRIKT